METEGIGRVLAELFEGVEGEDKAI